jgi:hypothetical protein
MSKRRLQRWFASIAPYAIAFSFSPWLVVLYSYTAAFSEGLNANDQGVIKGFIEWFGTAYSLFLALVLVNVWAQFDTVDREFDREIDAIASLYQTIKNTKTADEANKTRLAEIATDIIKDIKAYLEHVINNYRKEHLVGLQSRNGDQILEKISAKISLLTIELKVPEPLISQLFHSLNEAMDVRGDRISHSKLHTRGVVKVVSYVASIVWLFSFFTLVIYNPLVLVVLIGGVTFVIIMVLIIIDDLDSPFDGTWKVEIENWHEVLELINPNPHLIFVYNIENTITDQIKAFLGKKICKLNSLSSSGILAISWREYLDEIQRVRTRTNKKVRCSDIYSNEFFDHGYDQQVNDKELPLVILQTGDEFEVLLSHLEINDCSDLHKFKDVVAIKMRTKFDWF